MENHLDLPASTPVLIPLLRPSNPPPCPSLRSSSLHRLLTQTNQISLPLNWSPHRARCTKQSRVLSGAMADAISTRITVSLHMLILDNMLLLLMVENRQSHSHVQHGEPVVATSLPRTAFTHIKIPGYMSPSATTSSASISLVTIGRQPGNAAIMRRIAPTLIEILEFLPGSQ